ncbi:hypothetical protein GQX73_g9841 [Xylaria multiplex]|uniref:Rhodopsin domain-containing protein n=1 Tax=Xylaria multiplex TaxID=323545 RepID=A0A7C8IHD2_9PEZI|nr:hypothetical protein GQX73_g9841 [Xylaria multiplex]
MPTFSSFNQSTQQAILHGPALQPPPGYVSNFDNPPNGEAGAHAVILLSITLSTAALLIRLYCRWILARQRLIADYFFIIGWALFLADVVLAYNPTTVPVWFVHLWNIRLEDYITYLHNVFITSELYLFSVAFLKVGILLDWIHIFAPSGTRNFIFWAASITIFVNAGFYIGIIVANQVACTPYEYSWNKLLDGNCNRAKTPLATSIAGAFNIASDIVIFLIPQGVIWNLNMPRSRKIGMSVIFTLGLLAIGTAILRFISSLRHAASPDFTYFFTELTLCADAELTFGPVVRQGPNKLVFTSLAALRDIYKSDNTTKPNEYIALGPRLTIPTVFIAQDRQLHRVRRQLIGQAVSERSMRIFEPKMLEQVDIFLRRVLKSTQTKGAIPSKINMTESARLLGFDLAALLAFGYNLSPDKARQQFPFLTVFRRLRSQYLSLVQNIITSRIKEDKDAHHDLYSIVADHLDQSKPGGIRQSELWAEATSFLPAAGDTTKTALASIFFYLSQNPQCYNKLANEVRAKFMSGRDIRGSTLTDCHYLRACIDEALRMSPPVPGILWREGYADRQPFMVDGHIIPPGVVVGVNIHSVHYNEEYFPEPFAFRPERWLDDSKTMGDAFMPFSTGPRGCAGKAMAYLELSLVVAKTLWYFDFESAPHGPGQTQSDERVKTQVFKLLDNFTASHDGPYLVFKQRENLCKDLDDVHGGL